MEIVRVYALHSNFLAAAGRHLIVATAMITTIIKGILSLGRGCGIEGRVVLVGILSVFNGSRIGECGVGHHWRLVV